MVFKWVELKFVQLSPELFTPLARVSLKKLFNQTNK